MSESLTLGIILALAGGFMDAYSYMGRGMVFANAQTGNFLLLGVSLSQREWSIAVRYLCPILAFIAGIALADTARTYLRHRRAIHWRQVTLAVEMVIFFAVGFLPQSLNLAANSLVSFACGIQVESFRKINGNSIATTMCIGNLRSATQAVCEYWHTKNKGSALRGLLFFGIILCFVVGAVIGSAFVERLSDKAIWFCDLPLLAGFLLMFRKAEMQTE